MRASWQHGLQQGLQRRDRNGTERQRGDAASGSSQPGPATLPTAPPGNTPPSWEQPEFADHEVAGRASSRSSHQNSRGYGTERSYYGLACEPPGGSYHAGGSPCGPAYQQSGGAHGVGRSLYGGHQPHPAPQPASLSNTRLGALTDWRAVHQSMPPIQDTLPAVVQTLAPQSDPRPPATSSTGGRSRAKGLNLSDILNAKPVREKSPARASSPRREAFPRQFVGNSSGGASEDNILQPQPRSSQTKIDLPLKGAIWSEEETQVLGDVMDGRQRGDIDVYQRASERLGGARSPETCWKKWKELTAQKHGGEKVGKTHVRIAPRPATQYIGEPKFSEQYDKLLTSGWDVIDANKLHVLKYLDRRIKAKTLVLELGRKYSEESIRDQLLNLRDNGFLTRKPASRPWTGADRALYKERRERGASEEELMRACKRTREDIQETSEGLVVEDTVMSSKGHGKRNADDRKTGNDESKRRQRG